MEKLRKSFVGEREASLKEVLRKAEACELEKSSVLVSLGKTIEAALVEVNTLPKEWSNSFPDNLDRIYGEIQARFSSQLKPRLTAMLRDDEFEGAESLYAKAKQSVQSIGARDHPMIGVMHKDLEEAHNAIVE